MAEYLKQGWENWCITDALLVVATLLLMADKKPPKNNNQGCHGGGKDRRPKIRGSIFKRPLPVPRPSGRPK